jgi:hypothetical protein
MSGNCCSINIVAVGVAVEMYQRFINTISRQVSINNLPKADFYTKLLARILKLSPSERNCIALKPSTILFWEWQRESEICKINFFNRLKLIRYRGKRNRCRYRLSNWWRWCRLRSGKRGQQQQHCTERQNSRQANHELPHTTLPLLLWFGGKRAFCSTLEVKTPAPSIKHRPGNSRSLGQRFKTVSIEHHMTFWQEYTFSICYLTFSIRIY